MAHPTTEADASAYNAHVSAPEVQPVSAPIAAVDHAWLRMDEPANLMQINGVLVLDEPLPVNLVRAVVRRRLLPIARFRQRVAGSGAASAAGGSPGGAGGGPGHRSKPRQARWEEDPTFDLDRHVVEETLPAPGDDAVLAATVGKLMSTPLPAGRPLWEFRLLHGYRGSGCALLGRIHHAIGDGVALMLVLLSLTDLEPGGPPAVLPRPDEPEPDAAGRPAAPTNPFTELFCPPLGDLAHIRAVAGEVAPELMRLLAQPEEAWRGARLAAGIGSIGAFGRLVGRPADPKTALRGPLGVPKLVAWSAALPLADVKETGRALGGTINDVLVSAAAGGMRRYLESRGEVPRRLDVRAAMPVNLRPLGRMAELGNHFGLIFLSLPLGVAEPLARLAEVRRRSAALRRSAEPLVVYGILRAIGMVPHALQRLVVRIFATKATLVMTNVPGPRRTLYLAGRPIRDIFFWVPQSGRVGLGVSILSYDGRVRLGVGTDAGLVPDPRRIVDGFHAELDALMRLAGVRG